MKKVTLHLIILMACTMLVACSRGERTSFKIGVAQCSQGAWREKVNREMLAAQHLYDQDVEVSIANSRDDTELQLRQIDSLADAGIDLLVVAASWKAPARKKIPRKP